MGAPERSTTLLRGFSFVLRLHQKSSAMDAGFMKPVKLEDLVPQGAEFNLKQTGKTYKLRAVSAADEIWMKQTFGDDLQKVFSEVRIREICRIVFRIMEQDSKASLAVRDVTIMDESGKEEKIQLGGVDLLMTLVSGISEQVEILKALLQTIGISRPMIDGFEAEAEKKSLEAQLTGGQSSTSSPQSTAGRQNTPSAELPESLTQDSKESTEGEHSTQPSAPGSTG